MVKPIALLSNTLSMTGASVNNIKNKRIQWGFALPLVITSMIMAPMGAYLSTYLNTQIVTGLFVVEWRAYACENHNNVVQSL